MLGLENVKIVRWISVEDEMPDIAQVVLAYGVWEGEINGKEKVKTVNIAQMDNRESWNIIGTDAYAAWLREVTHWMPLPPPPDILDKDIEYTDEDTHYVISTRTT